MKVLIFCLIKLKNFQKKILSLIKKYFDVNLRKVKTDKKDAVKLANYCSDKWHTLKTYTIQDNTYEELKFLSRQYNQQISLKVKAKVQLGNLIDLTFPCFSNPFNIENQYLFMLDVYEKYFHPKLIVALEEKTFVEDIQEIAKKRGHRTGLRVGIELYKLAKETEGKPMDVCNLVFPIFVFLFLCLCILCYSVSSFILCQYLNYIFYIFFTIKRS